VSYHVWTLSIQLWYVYCTPVFNLSQANNKPEEAKWFGIQIIVVTDWQMICVPVLIFISKVKICRVELCSYIAGLS